MDPRIIPAPPPESPWFSWARPDIHHCEAIGPGWIAAPADTWSNAAYLFAALWLWRRREESNARALAAIVLAIGVTSSLFHASYTFCFQVFDYGGMFLYTAWILSLGLVRLGLLGAPGARVFNVSLTVLSIGAVLVFRRAGIPIQPLFGVQAVGAVALEAWLYARGREPADRRPLAAAVALTAAGFVFWNLDHADWLCRPDNHVIQGHAIWHGLTAASFVPAFLYYRQFRP
jgi:hypothetical protein